VQVAWIARALVRAQPSIEWTFDAPAFASSHKGVLLWEAFVTGASKRGTHVGDAKAAVAKFRTELDAGFPGSSVTCDDPISLVGAALLFAGSTDPTVLRTQCYVVRA
jgi:hypothetical protein